jgi:hypothetical protein
MPEVTKLSLTQALDQAASLLQLRVGGRPDHKGEEQLRKQWPAAWAEAGSIILAHVRAAQAAFARSGFDHRDPQALVKWYDWLDQQLPLLHTWERVIDGADAQSTWRCGQKMCTELPTHWTVPPASTATRLNDLGPHNRGCRAACLIRRGDGDFVEDKMLSFRFHQKEHLIALRLHCPKFHWACARMPLADIDYMCDLERLDKYSANVRKLVARSLVCRRYHQPRCDHCGRQPAEDACLEEQVTLKRCSGCYLGMYCSKRCQSQHWAVHKLRCGKHDGPLEEGFRDLRPKAPSP